MIRSAAPSEPDIAALWGASRARLDVARATDILWTLNHPDVWQLLVRERGWTQEQWEQWFADTACEQLLDPAVRRNDGTDG